MLLIALTISEAASMLGIRSDASKAEINAAYRDAISKYHPDANRSKSPEEQKRAEQMYKQVGAARKVMLNPQTAEPEPVDLDMSASSFQGGTPSASRESATASRASQSSNPTPQQHRQQQQQTYRASASSSQYVPQGHNTSRSFNDDVPRIVDPAEEQIAEIYREESRESYLSFADKARLTPSWAVSLAFLLLSIATFLMVPFSIERVSLSNPEIVMAIICLAKMFAYDTFASYYIFKAVKRISKMAWGIICGAEMMILCVVGMLLPGTAQTAAEWMMGCEALGLVGLIMCVVSVLIVAFEK